ncbi:zinc finger C2HC domain-containing protein 1A [Xenopus laevis]|uniref:Zinc finger C2HC domain-containing protein 1A n=1 Tax=Xenopus laevis TaxID=8355 RepID=ZC21A_XENLA|nr:zinc finger C2HC domain-containing protein 1A [Xenopus laevis]Q5PPV5.1 RecName: Full=Zinc finger C2HC domain-containing protein 1A [Xenopus laevis]AAH87481.1 LOC496067 protein [Xenopus laevis]
MEETEEELRPCKICGRTFFPATLKKHVPICQKTSVKKRKTFESSRQRAEGTDINTVKPVKPRPEPPKKQSNWKRKHEEFIATIRSAKGISQILKEGGELPPPPPPSYDPDYVQCPYCQRRFNQNAADRHINFCKEQSARMGQKIKGGTDPKRKPTVRPQYKPPSLKTDSPAAVSSPASRLPQPPNFGKPTSGIPSGKSVANSGAPGNKYQTQSPAHKNSTMVTSPQAGGALKARTPPSLVKNPSSGTSFNKRKTYNAENNARPEAAMGYDSSDYSKPLNDGHIRAADNNMSGQLTKFCHECGTKYPVEWAKFCCECGVRRMVL